MTLKDGCEDCGISSDTYSDYHGGKIDIKVEELKITDLNVISVASTENATGNGGHINLEIGQLTLKNGGMINASTSTSGNGGNITINANRGISLIGKDSRISNSVGDSGRGGNIFIKTPRLDMMDESAVQTGGFNLSTGDAGDIEIDADYLKLDDLSTIISSSAGGGRSGNIIIYSIDTELKQSSSIQSLSIGNANGGNITAHVRNRLYLEDSGIIANAMLPESQGNGGNITISKPQLFVLDKSQILASAENGKGGNITISANHFIHPYPYYQEGGNVQFEEAYLLNFFFEGTGFEETSKINASSIFGKDGEVWINASEEDISRGLTRLPYEPLNIKLLTSRCSGFQEEDVSTFFITSRDTLPLTPDSFRTGNYFP